MSGCRCTPEAQEAHDGLRSRITELESALLPFARYVRALKAAKAYSPPKLVGRVARLEPEDWDRVAKVMEK